MTESGPWHAPHQGAQPADPDAPPIPQMPQSAPQIPAGQSMYGTRPAPEPAQHQGGYGAFTFPVLQRAKIEPTAVLAIVTALLGPVAVTLGLIARVRVRRLQRRSMNLAWTGITLGALVTLGWVLVAVVLVGNGTVDRWTERPQEGDLTEATTVAASNVAVGNCIKTLPPGMTVGEIALVPCAQSHIAQAISSHSLGDGDFPGAEAVSQEAQSVCAADVAAISGATLWYLAPSETAWTDGVTEVTCVARFATPTEGSALQ